MLLQRESQMRILDLSDIVGGEVVMVGYQSLAEQLKSRVDNLHRKDTDNDSSTKQTVPRIRERVYGTVNFAPREFPYDKSEGSLWLKQATLKGLFEEGQYLWILEMEGHMKQHTSYRERT